MENLLKKVLYTGVGLVSTASENIQKNIDELVKKGSLSEEEGKKVVNDFVESTEAKREEFQARMTEIVTNVLDKLNMPSPEEFKSLTSRLAKLEKDTKTTAKTTAKKATTTAKKTTAAAKKAVTK